MRTVSEIFNALCEFAPLELQMDFDNSGFLFGRSDTQVDSVLLSLDITNAVIKEAIEKNVQLIISHHPLIWSAPKAITDNSAYTEKLLTLAENGIAAVSKIILAIQGPLRCCMNFRMGFSVYAKTLLKF